MKSKGFLSTLLLVLAVADALAQNQEYLRFGSNVEVPWQRHALMVHSELVSAQYLLRRQPEGNLQYQIDLNPKISLSREFFSDGFFDYRSVSDFSRTFFLTAAGVGRYFASRHVFVSSGLEYMYENSAEKFNAPNTRRTSQTSIVGSLGWDSRDFVFFEFHDFDYLTKGCYVDLSYRQALSMATDGKQKESEFLDRSLSARASYGVALDRAHTFKSMVQLTRFLNPRSRNETVSDLSLTMTSVILKDKINDTSISLRLVKFPANDTPTRIIMFLTRFRFFPRNDLALTVQGGLNVHLWQSPSKEVSLGLRINYFLNTEPDKEKPSL